MKAAPSARTLGCLVAVLLLLSAGAARAEVNRWESIGQMPLYGGNQGVWVYGLAFGPNGTLFAAKSLGIYKSTGDGVWEPALLVPNLNGLIPPDYAFFSILSQPGSPNTMLAGLSVGGVYRSTDGGQTWTSGLNGTGVLSMANGPASPPVDYASVMQVGSVATYRSDDGGATWSALPALGASPVLALAVDPTSSDVVFGYIRLSSAGLPAGPYRSTDGGGAWSRLAGGLADDVYTAFAVDPSTPSTVYAGSSANGLFRSDDGGESWGAIDQGLGNLQITQIVIDPTDPSRLYAGTKGGLYRSTDRGGHWSSVGFHQETFTCLALDPASPSTLYAGIPADLARITLAPAEPCVPGPEALCLNGGRFRVEAVWRGTVAYGGGVSPNAGGVGQASPITDDTGSFWFFDAANLELVVKVLDGGNVNGDFWVFYGALSNLEYIITVTDTETGIIQSYYNVGGTYCPANAPCPLASVADTKAFPGATAMASSALVQSPAAPVASAAAPAGPCVPDAQTLCELGGRFQVRVEWQGSPSGPTRAAAAVPLTDDTGYFWFFDAANVELVVKTLDGTAINGHFWVFAGALSNVQYTITVTDVGTGATQTYENPFGRLESFADTAAF
jgi:photosystem II stability/assembly factor-like uncharacterized protein